MTPFKANKILSHLRTLSTNRCQNISIICNKINELKAYPFVIDSYLS